MTALVIAEHDNAALKAATLHSISAALELGADVDVLVAGHNCATVAEQIAAVAGVSRVKLADAEALQYGLAEAVAPVVVVLADAYSHILAPATTTGKNLMPRVAAMLDVAQLSDISAVIDAATFKRPIYAGNAIATVQSGDSIKVLTVRSTAFAAAAAEGGQATIETVDLAAGSAHAVSAFVEESLAVSERPELTAAKVVISGGRGMASGDNFKLLEQVADKLGAAIGASRAAVDAGYVPNDMQVGQTGKIVAPDLYIAVGISGAIQHLAGMKDSKVIVAINTDEDAPIFQVADYGLVADLFDAVPALAQKL